MSLHQANDTRLTKTALDGLTTVPDEPDPFVVLPQDIYEHFTLPGEDGKSGRKLAFNAGQVVRQSEIDRFYPAVTIDLISPATGPAAGGTVVTITGTNLHLATGVTFGGTSGTAFAVANDGLSLVVTSPAKTAGAHNVVVQADSGDVTETGGFTTT
jgi:hypothetical protein